MIGILAATALFVSASADPMSGPQAAPIAPQELPATQLEDVTVTGRTLDQLIHKFVNEVAEPNRHRGLARWSRGVCVGVANLRPETAQYIADRVSTVAQDMGLNPGNPGCRANLLIVATTDGGDLARALVEESRRAFRMGGAGMDRGASALRDFQEADRPVRWWQVSMPVDSQTGQRATRLPGDCDAACAQGDGSVLGYAPMIKVFAASRLNTQIVDDIFRTVVIVDVDEVSGLTIQQLADYLAMVSLAQINPDADTNAYASILNVFDDPDASASLTDWDQAYLAGLYAAERDAVNRSAGRTEIADSIRDAHHRLRNSDPDGQPLP